MVVTGVVLGSPAQNRQMGPAVSEGPGGDQVVCVDVEQVGRWRACSEDRLAFFSAGQPSYLTSIHGLPLVRADPPTCDLTFAYSRNITSYMKTDSRLSSMLHILLHMGYTGRKFTSDELARMLQTNPVLVRRTLAGLRERGLVKSEKGHGGGWVVARPLDAITLNDVYEALGEPELFAIGHRRVQSPCRVEQAVNTALDQTLAEAEVLVLARLREITLAALSEVVDRSHPSVHNEMFHAQGPGTEP